jgi:hypothetical protein
MSSLLAEYWWAVVGAIGIAAAWVFLRRQRAHE